MKTKFYFMALVAVAVIASSCSGRMSVTAYNEAVVAMYDETSDIMSEKVEQLVDAENTSKEEAQTLVDELTTLFDDNIAKLNEMKYPEAAADWHKSIVDLYVYFKGDVIPLIGETINYDPESQEWHDSWTRVNERLIGTVSDMEDKVIEEQAKFAIEVGRELIE